MRLPLASRAPSFRERFCRRFPHVSPARQKPGPASVVAPSSNHRLQARFLEPPPSRLGFRARSVVRGCAAQRARDLGGGCLPARPLRRVCGLGGRGSPGPPASPCSQLRSEVQLSRLGCCPAILSHGGVGYPSGKPGVGVHTKPLPGSGSPDTVEQAAVSGATCALLSPTPPARPTVLNLVRC